MKRRLHILMQGSIPVRLLPLARKGLWRCFLRDKRKRRGSGVFLPACLWQLPSRTFGDWMGAEGQKMGWAGEGKSPAGLSPPTDRRSSLAGTSAGSEVLSVLHLRGRVVLESGRFDLLMLSATLYKGEPERSGKINICVEITYCPLDLSFRDLWILEV